MVYTKMSFPRLALDQW